MDRLEKEGMTFTEYYGEQCYTARPVVVHHVRLSTLSG
jgi:hypothetical protein